MEREKNEEKSGNWEGRVKICGAMVVYRRFRVI